MCGSRFSVNNLFAFEVFVNFANSAQTEYCPSFTLLARLYRVVFLTGAPLKVLSVRLHSKSHKKVLSAFNQKEKSSERRRKT